MAAQDRVLAGRNEYDQARDVRVGSAPSNDSLSVTLASDQGAVPVSLVDLGQATMSASLPVAIARDQGSLSVAPLVDGISFDSFGRQRISSPQGLFDAQFTNDLHPLLFEQIVNGVFIACHEFLHANRVPFPYIQTANLAVRCGMVATATVSTTMLYICCTVISEGGQEDTAGYRFTTFASLTAGSGARTHAISLRPKTTFNSIANRFRILIDSIEVSVRGSNPVRWELCIGQALTNPTFADVNATYSAMEASTAGTLSGDPAIVIDGGEVAVSTQSKSSMSTNIPARYPLTLNAAGAQRILGTYTVLLTGVGGTSAATVTVKWKEIR